MAQPDDKPKVSIVVDSAASLPEYAVENACLRIAPMQLMLNGRTYLDGHDLTPTAFYHMLKDSTELPTTSAPTPAGYLKAFREASENGHSVLCLTVASRFSSSFDSASTAAVEAKQTLPETDIVVLDSGNAAGGQGLVALEALRYASQGAELADVKQAATSVMHRVRLLAFIDTLYYLWKGGRVPRIVHTGSSLLRIKPLFELNQGEVNTIARPRTQKKAMRRLIELMRDRVDSDDIHATVMHADAADSADELRRRLAAEFNCAELFVSEFTPVMGAHIGPGLVGIAFWAY